MKCKFGQWILLFSSIIFAVACSSSKEELKKLSGDWTIVEANGQKVDLEGAYLSFNVEAGSIYGSDGCNSISTSFSLDEKAGELDLSDIATTSMLCDHMEVSLRIQSALDRVETFEVSSDGAEAKLYSEDKALVLVLKKRTEEAHNEADHSEHSEGDTAVCQDKCDDHTMVEKATSLQGDWVITTLADGRFIADLNPEQPATVFFDLQKGTASGSLSCNSFNARLQFDNPNDSDYDPSELEIESITTTRVACADMTIETAILKSLKDTDAYRIDADGRLGLYDDGRLLLTLERTTPSK